MGISTHLKTSSHGDEYYLNLYSIQVQAFIYDNLGAIISYTVEQFGKLTVAEIESQAYGSYMDGAR